MVREIFEQFLPLNERPLSVSSPPCFRECAALSGECSSPPSLSLAKITIPQTRGGFRSGVSWVRSLFSKRDEFRSGNVELTTEYLTGFLCQSDESPALATQAKCNLYSPFSGHSSKCSTDFLCCPVLSCAVLCVA